MGIKDAERERESGGGRDVTVYPWESLKAEQFTEHLLEE